MPRPLVAAGVLFFLAPTIELAAQADAAWLLPPDATVLVRVDSTSAWNELVRAFAPLAGEELTSYDLQAVLDVIANRAAPAAVPPRIDPALPLYLAVSLDPASGPALTFVAPVTNGQPFVFDPGVGPTTSVVHGSYTGVSNRAGYAANAAPNPLLAELRPGLASVRVDLEAIITTYRPVIDMGLSQFEMMLDQATTSDELPFDIEPLMEVYLEAARSIVNAADTLDLACERRADELALRFDYGQRTERTTGAVVALDTLLGYVDPASSVQVAFNGKWTEYLAAFESFTDAALEIYPEPLRSDMQRLLDLQSELDPLLLPGLVLGFDFGTAGMHGAYVMRSPQPEELQARIESLLRELDHEGGLLRVGAAENQVVDGLEARVLPLEIQIDALVDAMGAMGGKAGEVPPEAASQFRTMMESIYGRDLRLALVRSGELVAACLGGDDSELRAQVARLRAPAAPAQKLVALVERIEPGSLGFAYHLDFGRSLGQVFRALQGILPGPTFTFPEREASFGFWGSTGGRTWSGGMVTSLAEVIAFVQAVKDLERK